MNVLEPLGALDTPFYGLVDPRTDAAAELHSLIESHRFKRSAGTVVKIEGDTCDVVYFPLSGWLAISKSTQDGQRQMIDILLPGDMMDPNSADRCTSPVQIEALTNVTYAAVPQPEFLRLCQARPRILDAAVRNVGAAFTRLSERMLRLGKGTAQSVIAFALCELCLRSSAAGLKNGVGFHIPMTQQQLGEFCGLSAVHVCRTLRRLERNGVVDITDHMDIAVHDVDALSQLAGVDPEHLHATIVPAA